MVPVWQRRYSWDLRDWADLWKDLIRVQAGQAHNHFVGSFVLKAQQWSGLPSEARRYFVVDGQQRLTTLTIIIAAIRDRLARLESTDDARADTSAAYTSQLLRNLNLRDGHRQRLVLQEPDQSRLQAIVDGISPEGDDSLIGKGYRYFADQLRLTSKDEAEALLSTILVKVSAVWVTLEDGDNAHRVFQTLNAGGKPLRQSDLVRNYFFLLLDLEGDAFYNERWKVLENDLTSKELEEYFVAWSISQGYTGSKGSLFSYFQRDLSSHETSVDEIKAYGEALTSTSRLFHWIRKPEDAQLDSATKKTMIDLRNWGTLTAEGLLLFLLRARADDRLTDNDLERALEYVLSFMARRMMGGFEPQLHKSIFVATTLKVRQRSDLSGPGLVDFLRFVLSTGEDVRTWPTDDLVRQRIVSTPLYTSPRSAWVFSILERINRQLFTFEQHAPGPFERAGFQVEHVMPQKLTEDWVSDMTAWGVESPVRTHQTRLHVLGNLTLTRINAQLSNHRFEQKRAMLQDDTLRLNVPIAEALTWTEARIDERSRSLADLGLAAFASPLDADEISASLFDQNGAADLDVPEDLDED